MLRNAARTAVNTAKTAVRNFADQAPKQDSKEFVNYTADPAAPVGSLGLLVAGSAAYLAYEHYKDQGTPSTQLDNSKDKLQPTGKAAPAPTVAKSK